MRKRGRLERRRSWRGSRRKWKIGRKVLITNSKLILNWKRRHQILSLDQRRTDFKIG